MKRIFALLAVIAIIGFASCNKCLNCHSGTPNSDRTICKSSDPNTYDLAKKGTLSDYNGSQYICE